MFDFDLFVIGAGSGGVRAARMAAATGAKVACAEKQYLGGTCVNVGCVPKKLFYYGANYSSDFKDAEGFGWSAVDSRLDWPTLRDNKNKEIERLNGIYGGLFDNAGVTLIRGEAKLKDANTIEVAGNSYTAEKILIATGCTPSVPVFEGSQHVVTSDDIFYLDELPKKALVVGGGYIAVEFAGILEGLGVETELSYRGPLVLKQFDADLGRQLIEEMGKKGITVSLNSNVDSIALVDGEDSSKQRRVTFKEGRIESYDLVLYATGRRPLTDGIGLENTVVELRDNGQIVVDDYFQTAEPSIFALGDIIGTPELTPVALAQGMAFVDTYFKESRRKVDYSHIATAIFSHPNIGTVGYSEAQAKQAGFNVKIFQSGFRHLKHTLSGNQERTFMKLVVDADTDKVLGVHMMGADAGEIIQGLAVALKCGVTKAVLDSTIGIHPTAAEEFVTMREPVAS